jgi:pilus assembly protein Flp/PilA
MNSLKQAVMNFIREEEGLTVVEYAVAGALISLAVYTAFEALGLQVAVVIDAITAVIS